MPPFRQPDDFQVQEELALYSTLCLLEAQAGEGAKQVELHRNMFRKHNLKAFEYILHHAYSVVKGRAAAKKHLKWPYADKDPKQKKEFYVNASLWLKESGVLEGYGNSLEAFRRNPQGPKLVSFLLDLVTYALSVQQERMFPDDITVQGNSMEDQLLLLLREPLITSAKAQNQQQVQRLLKTLKIGADIQQQAEQSAAHLSGVYYSLRAQLAQAQTTGDQAATIYGWEQPSQQSGLKDISRAPEQHMQLPEDLMQQYSELEGLWGQLEQHTQHYKELSQIVDGLSGSDIHPHAIDAVKLRQYGQLTPAPNAAGLDIAAMMEAWLVDVGAVCRYIKYLAGQSEEEPPQPAVSQSRVVTPLLATSEASSHAPHLYAQLALHKGCLEHMRTMKTAMQTQMANIADRILKLEEELYGLIALERQACLAAMESVPLLPGAEEDFQLAPLQQQPAPPMTHGTSINLLEGGSLPLVPPTPMLQQLVHKSDTASHPPMCDLQSARCQVEERGSPVGSHSHITTLLYEPSSSRGICPVVSNSPTYAEPVSSASSVSSTALPAPELLLSKEHADELMDPDIMDLDLVDSDDDIYKPSSPVIRNQRAGGDRFDPLRLSMPQASLRYRSSILGEMEALVSETTAAAEQRENSTAEAEDDLGVTQVDSLNQGQGSSVEHRGFCTSLLPGSQDCEGEFIATSPGSTVEEVAAADQIIQPSDAAEREKTAADLAASAAADPQGEAAHAVASHSRSPPISQDSGFLAFDPMAPASAVGSDCFSSARPRRLTFAAAVSSDCGNATVCTQHGNIFSPSSSEVSTGSPDTKAETTAAAQPALGLQSGLSLSLLRQRFAATQQQ